MIERYLFRGKSLWSILQYKKGEWIYGGVMPSLDGKYFIINRSNAETIPVEKFTVGQCTGLKDKNGELIFEGDIVTTHYGRTYGTLTE